MMHKAEVAVCPDIQTKPQMRCELHAEVVVNGNRQALKGQTQCAHALCVM
jgi:hypothetical protein